MEFEVVLRRNEKQTRKWGDEDRKMKVKFQWAFESVDLALFISSCIFATIACIR